MKRVAFYLDKPGAMDYPFNTLTYFQSYAEFTARAAKKGLEVFIVRTPESHLSGTTFRSGWKFIGEELHEVPGPITVDLIYIKSAGPIPDCLPAAHIMHPPAFDNLCLNKRLTAEVIPEFLPKTLPINPENWREALQGIDTNPVVVKVVDGEGGEDVFILPKSEVSPSLFKEGREYVIQEFMDTSAGIPGLTDKPHDLRIFMAEGKPILSYLRFPPPGSLLANVALGGSSQVVDLDDLPSEVLRISQEIDQRFAHFPDRFYCIDFMIPPTGPRVVELNSRPGFPHPSRHGQAFSDRFQETLLRVLLSAAERATA